jgi:hypothetical protein
MKHYIQQGVLHPDKRKELSEGGIAKAMQAIQISAAVRESEEVTKGIIAITIGEAMQFYGVESPQMLRIMVDLVIREYWMWKLDDIILMVQKGINGDFGKQYGKFNGSVLQEWLRQYDALREHICEHHEGRYQKGIEDAANRTVQRHNGPKEIAKWTDEEVERMKQIDETLRR